MDPLDADTWGVVHGHLSTHELFRLKTISKSLRGLIDEGAAAAEVRVQRAPSGF